MKVLNFFDDFFEFEKNTNIFQIKNDEGIYLWDIFRYWVRQHLEMNFDLKKSVPNQKNLFFKFIEFVIKIFNYVVEILKSVDMIPRTLCFFFVSKKQYDNLFFMASQNLYKGSFIDQNLFDTYKMLLDQNNLVIESCKRKRLKFYKEPILYHECIRQISRFIYRKNLSETDYLCVHDIYELLINNFGKVNFLEKDLHFLLKEFYLDVYLWNKILKSHHIKRVFLKQHGIQKGFFYAAKQLNIPLYEFQHGIISKAHTSYSYPQIDDIENYIYMPYKFLTFSDYWCKSFYCPMPNKAIGNNYFSNPVVKVSNPHKILVISANLFGKQLAIILKKAINLGKLNPSDVIFKLHPNQYFEKKYFTDFFEGKVSVLTYEKSVNELLAESKFMITVCSTAVYEALQANTRVLIYTIMTRYREMELLFDDNNVFLFSNLEELETGMNVGLPQNYEPPVFFEKCTPEKIKKAIDE